MTDLMHRFFLPQGVGGQTVSVSGKTAWYLAGVLRLTAGQQVIGFDGQGTEYLLLIEKMEKDTVKLKLISKKQNFSRESTREIILFQAIPKADKMDRIIREATLLGVSAIVPMETERVVPCLQEEKLHRRLQRWNKIAAEASRLSGRTVVPRIHRTLSLKEALAWPADRKFFFWEKVTGALPELSDGKRIAIFIGPEGGFSDKEAEMAQDRNAFLCGLGPRILPVETAAVVAITLISYGILYRW